MLRTAAAGPRCSARSASRPRPRSRSCLPRRHRCTPRAAAKCDPATTLDAAALDAVFSRPNVGATSALAGYAGGDYQHAYPLPDGRILWLFQDMFYSRDDDLRDSLTVASHNAGLVQKGSCFRVIGTPGHSYLGDALTINLKRWFWPLDGAIGADGKLWVFVAEMANPSGTGAGWGARPVATWVARIDTSTLSVVSFTKAPDSGARLFGWSVESDATWSYLVGHCYRQFTIQADSSAQFDSRCMPNSYLARVPKGRFGTAPQYWTGNGWSRRASLARSISTRGAANPMSIRKVGSTWVNVTKVDDWWGLWIHVDKAPSPTGPWETAQSIWIVGDRKCDQCGIYHAFAMRGTDDGRFIVATSNGAPYELWYRNAFLYRPTFREVDVPTYSSVPGLTGASLTAQARTRVYSRKLHLGSVQTVDLSTVVPAGAQGARMAITLATPDRGVQVRAWACGSRPPTRPSAAAPAGPTAKVAPVDVALGPDARLCLASTGSVTLRVDVAGAWMP